MSRSTFFEMKAESDAFDLAVAKVIGELNRQGMKEVIADENVQRYMHGARWSHRANQHDTVGQMQTLSTMWKAPFQDIVDGDLSLILSAINSTRQEMHSKQMRLIYQMISETCDASGNTVSLSDPALIGAAFLEMLRKIELSVDREGNVSMPQLHAGKEAAQKIRSALEAQPPEFEQELERVKAEKIKQAFENEDARRARFKGGAK